MTEEASTGSWDAWSAALDGLEASVISTEELLRARIMQADLEPWTPPVGLGPLPADLTARARDIASRQRAIIELLPQAVETTHRQWDLTRRISEATAGRHTSIYIDTTA